MSKYYKAEDVQAIFSEENRPYNWTDTEAEVQEQWDFEFYKSEIESLPTIEISEDCISREYIIKLLKDNKDYINADPYPHDCACDLIELAPSVIPSRAEGEWKWYMGDIWTCTACGESLMCDDIECNNYCPNCGAKMKGADDDRV